MRRKATDASRGMASRPTLSADAHSPVSADALPSPVSRPVELSHDDLMEGSDGTGQPMFRRFLRVKLPTFTDSERERLFREEFFLVWRRTFQILVLVVETAFLLVVIFYFVLVVPHDYQYVSAFFGDRQALGRDLAHTNMYTPLLGLLLVVAVFTRLYSERTHVLCLALLTCGNFLAYGWAVHVRELEDDTPWLSRPPPNCTDTTVPELVSKLIVRSTVHISVALVADIGVVVLCPSFSAALAMICVQHVTHFTKARYLWAFHFASDLTVVLFVYHGLFAVLAVVGHYFRCHSLREQVRARAVHERVGMSVWCVRV